MVWVSQCMRTFCAKNSRRSPGRSSSAMTPRSKCALTKKCCKPSSPPSGALRALKWRKMQEYACRGAKSALARKMDRYMTEEHMDVEFYLKVPFFHGCPRSARLFGSFM